MITSRVMTFWSVRAYTADTRLSTSSPPRALLESLGTRLTGPADFSDSLIKPGWSMPGTHRGKVQGKYPL